MEELFDKSEVLLNRLDFSFVRDIYSEVHWESKLIGIKGARGVGKTTILLQRLRKLELPPHKAMYISLDDLFFTTQNLVEFSAAFEKQGGEYLFIDEVHKYEGWSRALKNIYDFQQLNIVFTGSSIVDISKLEVDLSRRVDMYILAGLSYKEYLEIAEEICVPRLTLDEIVGQDNRSLRQTFDPDFKPLAYWNSYLEHGYFPFFKEAGSTFEKRVNQVIRLIVEYDMAELPEFDIRNAKKLIHLFMLISKNVPYKPNITSLSSKIGTSRNSIYNYLYYLERAELIMMLQAPGGSLSVLSKPEKLYLENTNYLYVLGKGDPEIGGVRETFFLNQVRRKHEVSSAENGDFLVDDSYEIEIGGKSKQGKQVKGLENSFVVQDDVDFTIHEKFKPLWMFGLM